MLFPLSFSPSSRLSLVLQAPSHTAREDQKAKNTQPLTFIAERARATSSLDRSCSLCITPPMPLPPPPPLAADDGAPPRSSTSSLSSAVTARDTSSAVDLALCLCSTRSRKDISSRRGMRGGTPKR